MKKTILFIVLLALSFSLFSQNDSVGKVQIIQDARVDNLLEKHIYLNEHNPGIEGWRIQIFFEAGNYSKRMAIEEKSAFVEKHSDVPAYLIFQEPYYKVRVGDYRTKMEAEKFLKKIERKYPNAFVVKDEINFPSLN
ncbi:MAG: SPOR domain-containing protein [Bacteroidales bacterium]|nr:SPOR domain-containing protein [Bacteroidales bacterium]